MNNDSLNKFSDRKVSSRMLIIPIVSIGIFFVMIFGISYGYFYRGGVNNFVNSANVSFNPKAANKSLSVSSSSFCVMNIDLANMNLSRANNTTPAYSTSCSIYVSVNGVVGDNCTYDVYLNQMSDSYTYTGDPYHSFQAKVNSGDWEDVDAMVGKKIASGISAVTTTNVSAISTTSVHFRFFNFNGVDQSGILNPDGPTVWKYQLDIRNPVCNWRH